MATESSRAFGRPRDISTPQELGRYSRLTSQLETLQRLTAALASATTLQEIAEFIIEQVRPALRAEIGVIAVLSESGNALRNIGFKGVSQETVDAWLDYPLETPVPMAEAALLRRPMVVGTREERNRRYPLLAQTHGAEHGGAVVCFPLLAREELLGAVGFCFEGDRSFDTDELRFLQALADQCALAVERACWYERAQREVHARMAAERRLESVLESIDDHLAAYDREWRYVFVNEKAAKVLGKSREKLLGRSIWELFPDAVGNQYYQEVHQALAEQRIIRSEFYYAPFDTWFENRIYPSAEGVTVFSTDITWRKKAEQALVEADKRKDEFLATLAHELRNPLAPIIQCVRIAKSPRTSDAQKAWSHDVIERQARHMSLLLDDLLDVSRITRGRLELKRRNIELAAVIDAAVETARPLVEAKSHILSIEPFTEAISLFADPLRLAQVLSNLIKNAAKFTGPGGEIRVQASRSGNEVILSVIDNGIGIAPESLPKIFEMFAQVKSHDDRANDGMGIGLALARRLTELHGGSIEVRSDGIGCGSTFTVRVPIEILT